jgi:biotin carboxylase
VVAYASDPAAPTAAYVGNKLGLPSNPYEAIHILTNKDLYREFLRTRGFNAPRACSYTPGVGGTEQLEELAFPLMVKPVDSSGSKGVSKVLGPSGLSAALEYALGFSRAGRVVVEEYIDKQGAQIHGDGFVVNGRLRFFCLGDHFFRCDINPFVPVSTMVPSRFPQEVIQNVVSSVQGILDALAFRTGAINIEAMLDKHDHIHVMELGPRNGGNMVPQLVCYATGIDMVELTVRASAGDLDERRLGENKPPRQPHAYYVVHSEQDGTFGGVTFDPELKRNILEHHIFKKPGDEVATFNGSNCSLGVLLLRFQNRQEMEDRILNMNRYVHVTVDRPVKSNVNTR